MELCILYLFFIFYYSFIIWNRILNIFKFFNRALNTESILYLTSIDGLMVSPLLAIPCEEFIFYAAASTDVVRLG